jgi:hypothetical protein
MTSEVFYFEFVKQGDPLQGIDMLLGRIAQDVAWKGSRVAIKVHFGERGNYTHIRPEFVRRVVDFVKEKGGTPFLAETTTLYPEGFRLTVEDSLETAKYNGFSEAGLGCPIVIVDGPDGNNGVEFKVDRASDRCRVKSAGVARLLLDADIVIVFSHVKGHLLSGIGGAIKNLGMGCTTKASKREQHASHGLVFDYERCTGCGTCVDICKFSALSMRDGKPVKDDERCMYCNTCKFHCESGAIGFVENGKELFQEALSHAAAGVMKGLRGRQTLFLNAVMDVTPLCDCAVPAGLPVTQNVGILASVDPVAIDEASLDLLDKAAILPNWDVSPPDILGKINGTSSLVHIREGERLGMGSCDYSLINIEKEE